MNLRMNMDHMFKWREILEKERTAETAKGTSARLTAILKRIDAIDIVLDTAMLLTIGEHVPFLLKAMDVSFHDRGALQLAMPDVKIPIAGPMQVTIDYEGTEEENQAPQPEQTTPGMSLAKKAVFEELQKLLSKNFVDQIPTAINIFNERMGETLLPSDAWAEIKAGLAGNTLIPLWDKYLTTQLSANGPVMAFERVKKKFPEWDEIEIGRVLENAVRCHILHPRTGLTEARELEELIEGALDKTKTATWRTNLQALEVIETYWPELATAEDKAKKIGRIVAAMTPSTRVKMEAKAGRIPYVEKGY